jgi:hypothetical protein
VSKSSSRKKQDRAKAAARRAEQERLRAKAARERESAEHFGQIWGLAGAGSIACAWCAVHRAGVWKPSVRPVPAGGDR